MKLDNLQVLRGISALLVCCFHFKDHLNFNSLKIGDFLFSKGSIGVPIFFVISGFIMVYTTKKIDFTGIKWPLIKDFLLKRIIRIVPLYYLLTLGWIALGGSFSTYLSGEGFSRLWHSLLFLPQKDQFPVLYLGWSLNYEMYFYVIFALSFLFGKYRYYFIFTFFAITLLAGKLFNFESAFLTMMTSSTIVYFVIGMLLGLTIDEIKISSVILKLLFVTALISFVLFLIPSIENWSEIATIVVVTLLVTSFLMADYYSKFKAPRLFSLLGDISFSLYLVHPFIEVKLKRFQMEGWESIPFFLLMITLVIICSYLLYKLIEVKFTHLLKQKLL